MVGTSPGHWSCFSVSEWPKRYLPVVTQRTQPRLDFPEASEIVLKTTVQNFYRPQTKLREGNVFTLVSQSFRSQGLSWCHFLLWTAPPPTGWHPTGQHPSPPTRTASPQDATQRKDKRLIRILLECFLVNMALMLEVFYLNYWYLLTSNFTILCFANYIHWSLNILLFRTPFSLWN